MKSVTGGMENKARFILFSVNYVSITYVVLTSEFIRDADHNTNRTSTFHIPVTLRSYVYNLLERETIQ
jgi:hypothetical protein